MPTRCGIEADELGDAEPETTAAPGYVDATVSASEEPQRVCHAGRGVVDPGGVFGAGHHDQLGIRQPRTEAPCHGSTAVRVVLAPYEQHRHCEPGQQLVAEQQS